MRKRVIGRRDLSADILAAMSAHSGVGDMDGVEVVGMHSQSPARQSGLRRGDVVLALDDKVAMHSQDKYWMALSGFHPGQRVKYLVLRDNAGAHELIQFEVEIERAPQTSTANMRIRDARSVLHGCTFGELQPALGIELGMNPCKEGVLLMEMPYSSLAAHAGLSASDLLLAVDGVEIDCVDKLHELQIDRSQRHIMVIQRGDMVGDFVV